MEEKLLMVEALEARDLLVKQIFDRIRTSSFVGLCRKKDERIWGGNVDREEFRQQAETAFQELQTLMEQYRKLDGAIIASNAVTCVDTALGRLSVAQAMAIQSRLCGGSVYEEDAEFERNLSIKLEKEHQQQIQTMEAENEKLCLAAQQMRLSILNRSDRQDEEKSLEYVEEFIRENAVELLDPLNSQQRAEELLGSRRRLLSELETQIQISNASTYIALNGPKNGLYAS